MFELLEETGAQRALFAKFEGGERIAIATVAEGGVLPIRRANQSINLRERHYGDMYDAHRLGNCWTYEASHDPQDTSALEIGMVTIGAEVLVSCPVVQSVTVGAISVSFDHDFVNPEKVYPYLQRAAVDLAELE